MVMASNKMYNYYQRIFSLFKKKIICIIHIYIVYQNYVKVNKDNGKKILMTKKLIDDIFYNVIYL